MLKILVIKACRDWVFENSLLYLKEKYNEFSYSVITNIKDYNYKIKPDKIFYFEKDKKLSLFNIGIKNLKAIREEQFDILNIIYMNDLEAGYFNINFLARFLNIKKKEKYYMENNLVIDYNERYKQGYWNTKENFFNHNYVLNILKKTSLLKKKEVSLLDLGCGPSDLLNQFSKLKNVNGFGVDYSIEGVKFARNKGYKNSIVCADAKKLPFKKKSFDVIVIRAFSLIEFDLNLNIIFFEYVKEFLKDGGYFIMINPSINMSGKKIGRVGARTHSKRQLLSFYRKLNCKNIKIYFSKESYIKKKGSLYFNFFSNFVFLFLSKFIKDFYVTVSISKIKNRKNR